MGFGGNFLENITKLISSARVYGFGSIGMEQSIENQSKTYKSYVHINLNLWKVQRTPIDNPTITYRGAIERLSNIGWT